MSRAINRLEGQKILRPAPKSDAGKVGTAKSDNAMFTLAAGALGLGIALFDRQQAHAKDSSATDTSHDASLSAASTSAAHSVVSGMGNGTIVGNVSYDGHSIPVAVTLADLNSMVVDGPSAVSPSPAAPNQRETTKEAVAEHPASTGDALHPANDATTSEPQVAGETVIEAEGSSASATNSEPLYGGDNANGLGNSGDLSHAAVDSGPSSHFISRPAETSGNTDSHGVITTVGNVISDTVETVVDTVDGLLGGEDGDGILAGVTPIVSDTIETVVDTVDGLLGGEDGDGILAGVTPIVSDTIETVVDTVDGLLGGEDGDGILAGVTPIVSDTIETVVDTVDGLLGGGEDGDGVLAGVTPIVSDTIETVVDTVDGLLGGGEDGDGILAGVTSIVPDTVETAVDTVGGLLGGGEDGDGLLAGVAQIVPDTVGTAVNMVGGLLGSDDATAQVPLVALDNPEPSGIGEGSPNIFEAVGLALQTTEGLLGATGLKVPFVGQPILETDEHHDNDNPHGSLLHMHT